MRTHTRRNMLAMFAAMGISIILVLTIQPALARDCYFFDAPGYIAPPWVCSDLSIGEVLVKGYPYTAVGSEKIIPEAGFSFTRKLALMDARNNLAARIRTAATDEIRRFMDIIVADSSTLIDKYIDNTSINFTHMVLEDTPVIDSVTSPNGTLYVLIGLGDISQQSRSRLSKAIKSSFKDKEAEFIRELGEKNLDRVMDKVESIEENPEFMHDSRYSGSAKYVIDPETREVSKIMQKDEAKKEKEK